MGKQTEEGAAGVSCEDKGEGSQPAVLKTDIFGSESYDHSLQELFDI